MIKEYLKESWNAVDLLQHFENKLDRNYTRMLRKVFNKSWTQHPTKQQL